LELVNGRVPLLIELKNFSFCVGRLESAVYDLLVRYDGPFAVQSFNVCRSAGSNKRHHRSRVGKLSFNGCSCHQFI